MRPDGSARRGLADPSGGQFDAAGDFDQFLGDDQFPILGAIDPFADTCPDRHSLPGLLTDIAAALTVAKEGPKDVGFLRLQVRVERCTLDPELTLVVIGD